MDVKTVGGGQEPRGEKCKQQTSNNFGTLKGHAFRRGQRGGGGGRHLVCVARRESQKSSRIQRAQFMLHSRTHNSVETEPV